MDQPTPWTTCAPPRSQPLSAADWYTAARQAICAKGDPVPALKGAATRGDLAATADLAALGRGSSPPGDARGDRWLRQHQQIVLLAATDPARAEALLRDHVGEFGCDPVALFVVAEHLGGMAGSRLRDLRGRSCTC